MMRNALFFVFLAIDGMALLIALYFFRIGIGDGSISSFNIGPWLLLLADFVVLLRGGLALNTEDGAATALLALLGIPVFFATLLVLPTVVFPPRRN